MSLEHKTTILIVDDTPDNISLLCSLLGDRYRNKVQFPVFGPPLSFGLYAPRSHRPVNCSDCLLQPELLNRIAAKSCAILEKLGGRIEVQSQVGQGTTFSVTLPPEPPQLPTEDGGAV